MSGPSWASAARGSPGELDVDGDLGETLELGQRFRGIKLDRKDLIARPAARPAAWAPCRYASPEPPESEARLRGRLPLAAPRPAGDPAPLRRLEPLLPRSCSARRWSTRARTSPPRTSRSTTAQERKLDVVCRKLNLQPGERLLDVGCGWGSLVIHAATHYGVRAVGVTISPAQAELARERVREAGLSDQVEIRLADYRDTSDGPYDKIASVGMVEHVGTAELPAYFAHLRELLKPGGVLLNHGIVRPREQKRNDKSFAWRFVFPDGELQTLSRVLGEMEKAGLEPRDTESLREHYGLTLRALVREPVASTEEEATQEAGAERERIWRLHNIGAALGFERGDLSVHQVVAVAPGSAHGLPLARQGSARKSSAWR